MFHYEAEITKGLVAGVGIVSHLQYFPGSHVLSKIVIKGCHTLGSFFFDRTTEFLSELNWFKVLFVHQLAAHYAVEAFSDLHCLTSSLISARFDKQLTQLTLVILLDN